MLIDAEIPDLIIKKRDTYEAEYQKWKTRTEVLEGYYYNDVDETGTTFNATQKEKVEENTGIPVSLNQIYSIVEQKLAILAQTKSSSKVVAQDESEESKAYAYILDKIKNHVMYSSEALLESKETLKDMLVLGMGISGVFPTNEDIDGDLGVRYMYLHPSEVRLDVNSRHITGKDMKDFFIKKQIDEAEAELLFSTKIEGINELYGTNYTLRDFARSGFSNVDSRNKVISNEMYLYDVTEYYTKKYTTMYLLNTPDGMEFVFAENLDPALHYLLEDAVAIEHNKFVAKQTILGDKMIELEILPITEFPIRVRYFNWGGRPYRSYSVAHYLKGMQDAQDKALQLMIHNGMLINNAGWEAPYGSIPETEKSKYEQMGNKPGVVKTYNPVVIENTVLKPERTQIQALSNFYPELISMMSQAMEKSSGIYPFLAGDPSSAKIEVFSSLQQYQNAGMQRIFMSLTDIQVAEQYLGNVLTQWVVVKILPDEPYIIYDDQENKFENLKITQDLIRNFKMIKYKVLCIPAEAMPTQKLSMATELMKISQTTPDPIERSVYIKKAFALSDMRGFDEIQEEIDTAQKLQQQVQQLQGELERMQELNKQMENKVVNAELKAKITTAYAEAIDNVNTAEAKTIKDLEIAKLQEQLKEAKKPDNKGK
jgi:hypothetical protein